MIGHTLLLVNIFLILTIGVYIVRRVEPALWILTAWAAFHDDVSFKKCKKAIEERQQERSGQ